MRAVIYRLRRWLASKALSMVLLTAVVALVTGAVLSFAAGARRTATAPDRYAAVWAQGSDVLVQQETGTPVTEEIQGLDAVRAVDGASFVFGVLRRPGATESIDGILFAGMPGPLRSRLLGGRLPNPDQPNEFVATRSFVDGANLRIGDTLQLLTLTQEQADTSGFNVASPDGLTLDATLVGILESASELDDPTPIALFPTALLGAGDVGIRATLMTVDLQTGATVDDLRRQLDALPEGDTLSVNPIEIVSPDVRRAVDAQSLGLWVLTGVSAIAAIAVLGQLLGRQVRMTSDERGRLSAIGSTNIEIYTESIGRAVVAVLVGVLAGIVLAILTSPLYPIGFSRRLEPSTGVRVDVTTLALGALILVVGLLGWIALSLRVRSTDRRVGRGRVGTLTAQIPSAAGATGVRFAYTEQPGDSTSPHTAVIGLGLIVAAMAASATFASSLNRLVTEPRRFGNNFDMSYDIGADEIPAEVSASLESASEVSGLTYFASGLARHGSTSVPMEGMQQVKGDLVPELLRGRLPANADEIALGRLTANDLGIDLGDVLALTVGDSTVEFRVTGLIVVPNIGGTDQVGIGAVTTLPGLRMLDASAVPSAALITLAGGTASLPAFVQRVFPQFAVTDFNSRAAPPPSPILNVARVRPIPIALAISLGTLATVTIANVLYTTIRRRRQQLAVLRAVGADSGWILGMSRWQAIAFVLLPSLVGAVLGVLGAQVLFRRFVDSIGALNDSSIPFRLLAAIIVGMALIAIGAATISARRELLRLPAQALRSE